MEEKKTRGVSSFYAIIGVATLVVAIIGATFAFFSATQTSENDISGTTAEAGGITLTVTPLGETNTSLIPLNLITNQTSVDTEDQYADAMTNSCKDDNGNNICQVYKLYVKNNSTTSTVQVRGTLELSSDATNMYWKLISLTEGADSSTYTASTTALTYATNVKQGTTGDITVGGNNDPAETDDAKLSTVASRTLSGSGEATYYVVVWLEETGEKQEDTDAGKDYTGTVNFNAVDTDGNSSGITATFSKS